jgi:hypothetical protein
LPGRSVYDVPDTATSKSENTYGLHDDALRPESIYGLDSAQVYELAQHSEGYSATGGVPTLRDHSSRDEGTYDNTLVRDRNVFSRHAASPRFSDTRHVLDEDVVDDTYGRPSVRASGGAHTGGVVVNNRAASAKETSPRANVVDNRASGAYTHVGGNRASGVYTNVVGSSKEELSSALGAMRSPAYKVATVSSVDLEAMRSDFDDIERDIALAQRVSIHEDFREPAGSRPSSANVRMRAKSGEVHARPKTVYRDEEALGRAVSEHDDDYMDCGDNIADSNGTTTVSAATL